MFHVLNMGIMVQADNHKMSLRALRLTVTIASTPSSHLLCLKALIIFKPGIQSYIYSFSTSHTDTSQVPRGCYFDVQMCIVL